MPFWSLKKNKETPKKQGKPTEEELLKQDNCKTLTLKDGNRFILVGGTHSAFGGLSDGVKHYSRVREFFDVLEYDVICLEMATMVGYDHELDVKFFGELVGRIKKDKLLWGELNSFIGQLHSDYPKFAKLLSGEEKLGERELEYFFWVLQKLEGRFELSEGGRKRLADILDAFIKEEYSTSLKRELFWKENIYPGNSNPKKSYGDLFLSKAIKRRKDFVLCDCTNAEYPWDIPLLQLIFVTNLLPSKPLVVAYSLLFLANNFAVSSGLFMNPKYRKASVKLFNTVFLLTDAVNIGLIYRYREALTALQLLRLAEDFRKKNGRPGTFIYWSHTLHTKGVLSNLGLGKAWIKRKLESPPFSLLRPLYRDYILLETSTLPDDKRDNFLNAAKKAGIPVEEL